MLKIMSICMSEKGRREQEIVGNAIHGKEVRGKEQFGNEKRT